MYTAPRLRHAAALEYDMTQGDQQELELHRDWSARLTAAEEMIPLIGRLYRGRSVVTKVFGRPLVNRSPIEILRDHKFARKVTGESLTVHDTLPLLRALKDQAPDGRFRVDVGKLAVLWATERGDANTFVGRHLAALDASRLPRRERPQDIVLYGFGRIGRLLARMILEMSGAGQSTRLRAIVVRPGAGADLVKRASLLRRDSVHGPFRGTINVDPERKAIVANGNVIQLIEANAPDEVDYAAFDIDDAVVIDNTGKWRDEEGLSLHLASGRVSHVVLTAPGKGAIKNVVYGINHDTLAGDERIVSAASCTTNAIVPVLKVLNDAFGIDHGHLESCHAYTNDQNLIDNFHKKPRRGRAAALNMVITETGAAKAVAKALPELAGKLTGSAIRVPTPNVSLAIMTLQLERETTVDELNDRLRRASLEGPYQLQIDYSSSPDGVSTDFVGNGHAGILDAPATLVQGSQATVYVWYDNEYGYSRQVIRIVERVTGLRPPTFPR